MARFPSVDAKTDQLVVKGRNPEEILKIKGFKELHRRNGTVMNDTMMDLITAHLKEHNWPPGNSQTVLEVFQEKRVKTFCRHAGKARKGQTWCRLKRYWMLQSECLNCEKRQEMK